MRGEFSNSPSCDNTNQLDCHFDTDLIKPFLGGSATWRSTDGGQRLRGDREVSFLGAAGEKGTNDSFFD
ncbi:hypothetical protein [Paraburkholderia fungorum]|uniref:hypothetical protein n=1 Tax=Paraburkholderia fungorum TaxID=134537 RepID=UPI00402B76C7